MGAIKTVIVVLLLTMFFSCGKDSTGPSTPADYLPLAVGNQWNYSMTGYMKTADRDSLPITGAKVMTVTGQTTHSSGLDLYALKDSTCVVIPTRDTSFVRVSTVYIFKADSEYRIYDDTLTAKYGIAMKIPVVLGDSWVNDPDEPAHTTKVTSVTSNVTVPAGSYSDCVCISEMNADEPREVYEMYFSRGNGVVEIISKSVDSGGIMYMDFGLKSSVIK